MTCDDGLSKGEPSAAAAALCNRKLISGVSLVFVICFNLYHFFLHVDVRLNRGIIHQRIGLPKSQHLSYSLEYWRQQSEHIFGMTKKTKQCTQRWNLRLIRALLTIDYRCIRGPKAAFRSCASGFRVIEDDCSGRSFLEALINEMQFTSFKNHSKKLTGGRQAVYRRDDGLSSFLAADQWTNTYLLK